MRQRQRTAVVAAAVGMAQDRVVHATLTYGAPVDVAAPKPNFSPKGTQVALTDLPAGMPLPAGAGEGGLWSAAGGRP